MKKVVHKTLLECVFDELKQSLAKDPITKREAKAIDSVTLNFVARLILKAKPLERERLIPVFNECAKRISWGCLPQSASTPDVFAQYRSIITWTPTALLVE